MLTPLDFIIDLSNPDLWFLLKALLVACMSSVICGIVGCYVVLRGMAFIGDAVAHSVFPGLAIAFVLQGNLLVGGALAGIITAVIVALFSQNRKLREDSFIGVFFVSAFALGIVVISKAQGYAGSLESFLFGSITGIPDSDITIIAITGVIIGSILFLFHKELVCVSMDRQTAAASGLPVLALDIMLYVVVAVAVVVSVQIIGNVLVLALLVAPAATARLLTNKLTVMMVLSPVFGCLASLIGMYLSWSLDLATGGTIVLVSTTLFICAWGISLWRANQHR